MAKWGLVSARPDFACEEELVVYLEYDGWVKQLSFLNDRFCQSRHNIVICVTNWFLGLKVLSIFSLSLELFARECSLTGRC